MNIFRNTHNHKCPICGSELTFDKTFFYHVLTDLSHHTESKQWGLLPNQRWTEIVKTYNRVDVGICSDCRKKMKKGKRIVSIWKLLILCGVVLGGAGILSLLIPESLTGSIRSDFGIIAVLILVPTWFIWIRVGKWIGNKYAQSKGYPLSVSLEAGEKANSLMLTMMLDSAPEPSIEGMVACSLAREGLYLPLLCYISIDKEKCFELYKQITGETEIERFYKSLNSSISVVKRHSQLPESVVESMIDQSQDEELGL